jgi:hypothetical protein
MYEQIIIIIILFFDSEGFDAREGNIRHLTEVIYGTKDNDNLFKIRFVTLLVPDRPLFVQVANFDNHGFQ